jgi:ABC-type uncharacterized transport system permease subunit
MADGIKDGRMSVSFLRPYHYFVEVIAKDIGEKVQRFVSLIPFLLILAFVFRQSLVSPDIRVWPFIVLSLVIGYVIKLMIESSLGLLAYWIEDVYGVERMYDLARPTFKVEVQHFGVLRFRF